MLRCQMQPIEMVRLRARRALGIRCSPESFLYRRDLGDGLEGLAARDPGRVGAASRPILTNGRRRRGQQKATVLDSASALVVGIMVL